MGVENSADQGRRTHGTAPPGRVCCPRPCGAPRRPGGRRPPRRAGWLPPETGRPHGGGRGRTGPSPRGRAGGPRPGARPCGAGWGARAHEGFSLPSIVGKTLKWICTGRAPGVCSWPWNRWSVASNASHASATSSSWSAVSHRLVVVRRLPSSHRVGSSGSARERLDLACPRGLELAAHHRTGEGGGGILLVVRDVDREPARRALPPTLARRPTARDLADEAVPRELAQVVAHRPAGLAHEVREAARGERAVRREQVEDLHPQGCASALSCAGPRAGWRSVGSGVGAASEGMRRP